MVDAKSSDCKLEALRTKKEEEERKKMTLRPGLFSDCGVQQLLRIAGCRRIHTTISLFGEVKTAGKHYYEQ